MTLSVENLKSTIEKCGNDNDAISSLIEGTYSKAKRNKTLSELLNIEFIFLAITYCDEIFLSEVLDDGENLDLTPVISVLAERGMVTLLDKIKKRTELSLKSKLEDCFKNIDKEIRNVKGDKDLIERLFIEACEMVEKNPELEKQFIDSISDHEYEKGTAFGHTVQVTERNLIKIIIEFNQITIFKKIIKIISKTLLSEMFTESDGGWSPFHYAARYNFEAFKKIVLILEENDKNKFFQICEQKVHIRLYDGETTISHVAIYNPNYKEILHFLKTKLGNKFDQANLDRFIEAMLLKEATFNLGHYYIHVYLNILGSRANTTCLKKIENNKNILELLVAHRPTDKENRIILLIAMMEFSCLETQEECSLDEMTKAFATYFEHYFSSTHSEKLFEEFNKISTELKYTFLDELKKRIQSPYKEQVEMLINLFRSPYIFENLGTKVAKELFDFIIRRSRSDDTKFYSELSKIITGNRNRGDEISNNICQVIDDFLSSVPDINDKYLIESNPGITLLKHVIFSVQSEKRYTDEVLYKWMETAYEKVLKGEKFTGTFDIQLNIIGLPFPDLVSYFYDDQEGDDLVELYKDFFKLDQKQKSILKNYMTQRVLELTKPDLSTSFEFQLCSRLLDCEEKARKKAEAEPGFVELDRTKETYNRLFNPGL